MIHIYTQNDIVEIWFGIANGYILSIFDRVYRSYLAESHLNVCFHMHWYCGDLVWDCLWVYFVNFRQSLSELPAWDTFKCLLPDDNLSYRMDFHQTVYALIFWRSGLGLLMGKFCQFINRVIYPWHNNVGVLSFLLIMQSLRLLMSAILWWHYFDD